MELCGRVYCLIARNNLQETEIQPVSQFLNDLKDSIRNELSLHTLWTLSDAIELALKVEARLVKQTSRTQYPRRAYSEPLPNKPHSLAAN